MEYFQSFIFSRQLKANNCVPQIAINGAEAIDLVVNAGDNTFDCILMDCEMVSHSVLKTMSVSLMHT